MRALVLAGGGAKGAFEIGVLSRLIEDQKRDYDILCGISVGALNASFLAMAEPGPQGMVFAFRMLRDIWFEGIRGNDSVYRRRGFGIPGVSLLAGYLAGTMFKTWPLRELIWKHLDQKKILASGKKLRVGAVAFDDGEYKEFAEDHEHLADCVEASAAFPGFFEFVQIPGTDKLWYDGGVRNVIPLKSAVDMKPDEIDVITTAPRKIGEVSTTRMNLGRVAKRTVDLMSAEIRKDDIIESTTAGIKVTVYEPLSRPGDPLNFDPKEIRRMYEMGRSPSTRRM